MFMMPKYEVIEKTCFAANVELNADCGNMVEAHQNEKGMAVIRLDDYM